MNSVENKKRLYILVQNISDAENIGTVRVKKKDICEFLLYFLDKVCGCGCVWAGGWEIHVNKSFKYQ